MNKLILLFAFVALSTFTSGREKSDDLELPSLVYASFVEDKSVGVVGDTFTFTNQSQGFSDCVWTFGDGDTLKTINSNHIFRAEGIYQVKLTVTQSGVSKNYSKSVQVFSPNNLWAHYISANIDALDSLYLKSAFAFTSDGKLLKGSQQIEDYYVTLKSSFVSIDTVVTLYEKDDLATVNVKYEIVYFSTSTNESYKQFVIWSQQNGVYYREFEMFAKASANLPNVNVLDSQRTNWKNLANAHNVNKLISALYWPNAVYYYNSEDALYEGSAAIGSQFGYMGSSSFVAPLLKPYRCEAVNDSLIFEVGQWYYPDNKGDYIFVWTKGVDGQWRVLLDSDY